MGLFSRREEVVSNAHFSGSKVVKGSAVVHLEFGCTCNLEVDPCLLQRRGDLRRVKLEITQGFVRAGVSASVTGGKKAMMVGRWITKVGIEVFWPVPIANPKSSNNTGLIHGLIASTLNSLF